MTELQERIWDCLAVMDQQDLLCVITDYHGMQLLDEGFYVHLIHEGLMYPE